ncbi:DUF4331 family protein [Croceicoccus sediminis]|uniref:DUF4331 family protein n=1 Tax=Croceicoccus sediminis TaxID=2571150 RepID=UPI00147959B4|nr:DUF4331 family protein [Croceicoccus sediminis]
MTYSARSAAKALGRLAPITIAALLVSGCGGDDDYMKDDPVMMPSPSPSPSPTATPTPTASYDVTACLTQEVAPGVSVADLVVPDTLTLNLAGTSGFPNGRKLADPVIDVTLAVIFLDLSVDGPGTLAGLPLNPPKNDVAFRSSFPFLAAAQGSPPTATQGSGFDFRSDGASAYTRVDRMGMPAVSTALIGSDQKNAYNDADPADDASGVFVDELTEQLTGLTNALADDLVAAGLTPCATPVS